MDPGDQSCLSLSRQCLDFLFVTNKTFVWQVYSYQKINVVLGVYLHIFVVAQCSFALSVVLLNHQISTRSYASCQSYLPIFQVYSYRILLSTTRNAGRVSVWPTWNLNGEAPKSTTAPLSEDEEGAMEFSLWREIGEEFLITGNG